MCAGTTQSDPIREHLHLLPAPPLSAPVAIAAAAPAHHIISAKGFTVSLMYRIDDDDDGDVYRIGSVVEIPSLVNMHVYCHLLSLFACTYISKQAWFGKSCPGLVSRFVQDIIQHKLRSVVKDTAI